MWREKKTEQEKLSEMLFYDELGLVTPTIQGYLSWSCCYDLEITIEDEENGHQQEDAMDKGG